ncbi:probable cytochrome P450 6a13 [Schistocerca serialis cubense]|uniref:probable cytochrome P450 6a13 n=1 Tax=Schistocerca serialis cubense TaxID=2023355 RepID=UPI00214E395F|nr:probable cytochrome P450 6a13 [Schistocerca serialis cubense]
MLWSDSLWTTLLILTVIIALLYVYLSSVNNYWKRLGVPCVKSELLFGSARRALFARESLPTCIQRIYQELGDVPFGGFYLMMTPCLMVKDVGLINKILVSDFAHFTDRFSPLSTKMEPLAKHLFCLGGDLWREMRLYMSSAFSDSSCRRDFCLVKLCCDRLQQSVHTAFQGRHSRDLALRDLLASFTTDVIGMCAFGIECGAIDDPNSQFRRIGSMIVPNTKKKASSALLVLTLPRIGSFFGVKFFSTTVREFFDRIVMETIDYRKKNNIHREDLVQLMLELKDGGIISGKNGEAIEVTDNLVVSQMMMAFTMGFEMTSSAMSFCLHELSLNPAMQTLARKEVDAVLTRHGGEVTYEAIQEMTYLDMLIAETLRLYPMQMYMMRQCTKTYQVPGSDLVLQKGTMVYLPVLSLQRDPRFYPDPLRFDPQRFANCKGDVVDAPYWPFGEGPRACLGQKFALMVVKAGLVALLSRFEFRPCLRSSGRPADFEPHSLLARPAGGLWVRVSLRPWLPLQ